MAGYRFGLFIILAFVSVIYYISVKAQDEDTITTTQVVERHVIVTPVPAPKEVIVTPTGFVNCFTVEAGWYRDAWIPEHKVCQYENSVEGVAWVEGYWACNQFTTDGTCTGWEWKPGHWEKTLDIY